MILHITFTDGSNPLVCYGDRETVKKAWKGYENTREAIPEFFCGEWRCRYCYCDEWAVFIPPRYETGGELKRSAETFRFYKRLGNALRALEKLGG